MTATAEASLELDVENQVYDQIVSLGGSFTAKRGESFIRNVARTIAMPGKMNDRVVYDAVLRLVMSGRLVRESVSDFTMQYGSLTRPSRLYFSVARFSVVS